MATDVELWRRAVDGDPNAFGLLFERHARTVYNCLFRRTADWSLAEDLTSVVFLATWRPRAEVRFKSEAAGALAALPRGRGCGNSAARADMKWSLRPEAMLSERDLPDALARRQHLVEGSPSGSGARPSRGLRLVAIAAALVLLAGTGLTAYAVVRGPTHVETVACYEQASLGARGRRLNAHERAPTELCGGEVYPHLAACVLQRGRIGVFPGAASTCSALGLADLAPDFPDAAAQLAA